MYKKAAVCDVDRTRKAYNRITIPGGIVMPKRWVYQYGEDTIEVENTVFSGESTAPLSNGACRLPASGRMS